MSVDHSLLKVNGRNCTVNVFPDLLTARTKSPSKSYGLSRNYSLDIKISDIIAIKRESADRLYKCSDNQELLSSASCQFNVHYIKREKNLLRPKKATFQCKNCESCEQWIEKISGHAASLVTNQPKKLIVFVNPYGGKKNGKKIYEQKVAPLFNLAGIEVNLIETERVNHAKKLVSELDLSQLDGIVVVGGDGTFAEVVNGLLLRTQEEAGLDPHQISTKLVTPPLKIGIIPAGSTDVVVYGTTGVNDPVTSALLIIIGATQPLDICSVHHDDRLLCYSVSFMGYGYFGDLLKDSEARRWMGPFRYDYAGIKKFFGNKIYEGEISFIEDTGMDVENMGADIVCQDRKAHCRTGCDVCDVAAKSLNKTHAKSVITTEGEGVDNNWQHIRGSFLGINAPIFSCSCKKSPEGMSPRGHLGSGTLDLILLRDCSRTQHLRHLYRLSSTSDQFDFNFVEVKRIREFRFRSTPSPNETENQAKIKARHEISHSKYNIFGSRIRTTNAATAHTTSVWNIDGEVVNQTDINVKVHCQLIKLFANGIEAKDEKDEKSLLNCYH